MAKEEATRDAEVKAINLIRESGILNPDATLDKIADLTQEIAELEKDTVVLEHSDTFIHRHFIYKHVD
jgi:hypothetical protein